MRKPAVWVHPKHKGKKFSSNYKDNRRKHDRSFELKEIVKPGTKKKGYRRKYVSFESWQAAVNDGWKKVV